MGYFSYNGGKQYLLTDKDTAFGPQKRFSAQFIIVFSIISLLPSCCIFGYFSHLLKSKQKQRNPKKPKTDKKETKKSQIHSNLKINTVTDINFDVNLALRVCVMN